MHATKHERIRALNDSLRTSLDTTLGKIVLTSGVTALAPAVVSQVLRETAGFDAFDAQNDPHGEHDFGSFDLAGDMFYQPLERLTRWGLAGGGRCDSVSPAKGNDSEVGMSAPSALRGDVDAEELRDLAVRTKNAAQARRLLALAAVCAGETRARAAEVGGMDRQTLRDWVHRFNARGVEGLINIKPTGRPSRLSDEQKEDLRQLVEAGPDAEKDGVVRWRCADLQQVLSARHDVDLSQVRIGCILKELGFSHISARPQHPAQDPAAISDYKKSLSGSGRPRCGETPTRNADRGVVSRRDAGGSEERPRVSVGQDWNAAAAAEGPTLRQRLSFRCGVP